MKELIPLYDNLIVKPSGKQTHIGILVVPEAHQKEFSRGEVMDMAKGCSSEINKGDIVIYNPHDATPLDVDGEKHHIITETRCLALYREKKDPRAPFDSMKLESPK